MRAVLENCLGKGLPCWFRWSAWDLVAVVLYDLCDTSKVQAGSRMSAQDRKRKEPAPRSPAVSTSRCPTLYDLITDLRGVVTAFLCDQGRSFFFSPPPSHPQACHSSSQMIHLKPSDKSLYINMSKWGARQTEIDKWGKGKEEGRHGGET